MQLCKIIHYNQTLCFNLYTLHDSNCNRSSEFSHDTTDVVNYANSKVFSFLCRWWDTLYCLSHIINSNQNIYCLPIAFTNSKEQSPSRVATSSPATQKITRISWNPKVHYRLLQVLATCPILSQIHPVHVPHTVSWKHILIFSYHLRLGLPSGLYHSGFPPEYHICIPLIPSTCHILLPSQFSRFYHPNTIWWVAEILPTALRHKTTRVGTLIVAAIYLQLIQNRYMFPSFTVLQCSHQHCVQPVASDVEVVGYL